jgi:hypothetical protein
MKNEETPYRSLSSTTELVECQVKISAILLFCNIKRAGKNKK